MDKTNQWKTTAASPSTDDDHDALAKRLSENWASSAPRPHRMGGQVLQRLDMAAFTSSQWKARDREASGVL